MEPQKNQNLISSERDFAREDYLGIPPLSIDIAYGDTKVLPMNNASLNEEREFLRSWAS